MDTRKQKGWRIQIVPPTLTGSELAMRIADLRQLEREGVDVSGIMDVLVEQGRKVS